MNSKKPCGCAEEEFNAQEAFKSLQKKHVELAKVVKELIGRDNNKALGERSEAYSAYERLSWIIGGEEVNDGDFPECCLVGRYISGSLRWMCTGVLIHKRIVITAGHCFTPYVKYEVALNTTAVNNQGVAERIPVKKAILHPGYDHTRLLNDITVLVLERDAITTPVKIASSDEITNSTDTQLVGFGNNNPNGNIGFGIKREVTVPVRSIRRRVGDDLSADEYKYGFESDLEFVAGGDGYDSCTGDSGGPAYIIVDDRRRVAGITSRPTRDSDNVCGDGGIYTRLDAYIGFINDMQEQYITP